MKLTIEIPDNRPEELWECAAIGYWARVSTPTRTGNPVIEITEGMDVDGETTFTLTHAKMRKGLQVMAEKYPERFGEAISEMGWDAETGDVFVQCALFGRIVFG